MSRTVYVDGQFMPEEQARISVFDRGFLMADAIYEVTSILDGKLVDFAGHLGRLKRSLQQLEITNPMEDAKWLELHREIVDANQIDLGIVYSQVTRGNPGDRDFRYPPDTISPSVVMFTQAKPDLLDPPAARIGWKVITVQDIRWGRRDIKTTQLLFPSMAKMLAHKAGVDDAWLVDDGQVTEGTSNNVYLITSGTLITRPLSHDILHGITRSAILQLAEQAGLAIEERSFSIAEAQASDEAFATSASAFVMPVVEIDGKKIGLGRPGRFSILLRKLYIEHARKTAI